ncbi:hypothetical protein HPB52_019532 [Rhipicephalus sanguineus]|uniref:RNase H type-1 domain-containing protein n=1 Tax=Rhipicephalus sanguineus TaxID=34632 RepID=A0A9D4YQK6_RHISA|nr:hypothetical protein HPB52_019532 [Rhipicephalus sanguineus]
MPRSSHDPRRLARIMDPYRDTPRRTARTAVRDDAPNLDSPGHNEGGACFSEDNTTAHYDRTSPSPETIGYQDCVRELDRRVDIPDEIRSTFTAQSQGGDHNQDLSEHKKKTPSTLTLLYIRERERRCGDDDRRPIKEKVRVSLKNCTVSDAEEAAVALEFAEGNWSWRSLLIITDSQYARRGCTNGRVGRKAAGILNTGGVSNGKHQIIWPPGHEGIAGNLQADLVARGYASDTQQNTETLDHGVARNPQYTTTRGCQSQNITAVPVIHNTTQEQVGGCAVQQETGRPDLAR